MTGALRPPEITLRAQVAALLEASAPKPGNVGRHHDFGDTSFDDFLLSAAAIGPALGEAATLGVGGAVEQAIAETRRWVRTNTNLGIVLLFAPLARAAALDAGPLRSRVSEVLAELTVADARAAYAAIRAASPGGLGEVPEQDVRGTPTASLREAMRLAADRDSIAREYVTDFALTFETALPALRRSRTAGAGWPAAVLETFLTLLAAAPDSLIARKRGPSAAAAASREAARVLACGPPGSAERDAAVARLDRALRSDGNALNPGTTADLTAAAIFALLLEDGPSGQE
ncbi:MAG TPA: triphosphoribosyl-dephospho-CoA synthase [Longimicrobiales bacterium]|nr:triphosphoribosyl-dephospho-CoA synthase [Longimicrobiales bacterium]